jgi:chromatin remodeling complex protein RSC6
VYCIYEHALHSWCLFLLTPRLRRTDTKKASKSKRKDEKKKSASKKAEKKDKSADKKKRKAETAAEESADGSDADSANGDGNGSNGAKKSAKKAKGPSKFTISEGLCDLLGLQSDDTRYQVLPLPLLCWSATLYSPRTCRILLLSYI